MSPFNSNGSIRQQDVQARNIARQTISQALAYEAQRTATLVTNLIGKILDLSEEKQPVDELWNQVQTSPQLATIKTKADANVADYPEFARWVSGHRAVIERQHKNRIAQVVGPIETQRRYANAHVLSR
jgi:hypothetical protein